MRSSAHIKELAGQIKELAGLSRILCAGLAALFVSLAFPVMALAMPSWANPVTTGNLTVVGFTPSEIVEWVALEERTTAGAPIAVVMAKAVTHEGATVLDEVLLTKYSIGIYAYNPSRQKWLPLWERVTGQLNVGFVDGYDILDINGDGRQDIGIRIRYYGPGRALDYVVKTVENGSVRDLFEEKSIYQGSVTASTGFIVIDRVMRETPGFTRTDVYEWTEQDERFEKIREIRNRISE
jgi:hypothetical protein